MSTVTSVEDPAVEQHRLSDAAARRLAYGVAATCLVCYAVALVLDFLNPDSYSSWGTGSAVTILAFVVATMCFAVVGVLILHRHPRNTIGWLMLAIGAVWAWSAVAESYVLYGLVTSPGALPAPELVAALSSWSWVLAIGLTGVYLILLFPDGHLPSRRWRPVAWVAGGTIAFGAAGQILDAGVIDDTSVEGVTNPLGVESLGPFFASAAMTLVLLPICILLSAAALVVRFRRSRGVERLQLKWLATAAAFVALVYAAGMTATLLSPAGEPTPFVVAVLQDAGMVSFIVIPVAIGVAILKHRLYGIDVVINKSLVFGALATFITTVYVVIVVGVGALLGRSDRPNLALSIAATAVVAVAFQPVRDRVQRLANRLVYGARATPYEVLADFADRMGGAYPATELLPMMARTVGQGVGAATVAIWLSSGTGLEREASWPGDSPDPAGGGLVDDLELLQGDRVVPVRHHGELLGAITVDKAPGEAVTPAEDKLLEHVAGQAGLVLRNVRLIEDLRGSRQRLVRAQDEERKRLERNLHDGAQQSLVAVALMIRMTRTRLAEDSVPVAMTLEEAADQLSAAIEELRVLARGIHPAILSERGLVAAIGSLAERSPVPVVVVDELDERPPPELEATLYYVVAEALANVVKHARATEVEVTLTSSEGQIVLEVGDDGVGGCDRSRGTGLLGLADRVSVVDGTLEISSPPGGGTRITCRLPLPAPTPSSDVAPAHQRSVQPLGAGQ